MRYPTLLVGLALVVSPFSLPAQESPIDREAVVTRHNVHLTEVNPEAPLSLGNGDFAIGIDASGLQSLADLYFSKGIPVETMSTWAWHEDPNPDGLTLADSFKSYDFHGRTIQYAALQSSPAGKYFRENPHPQALGQLSFLLNGQPLAPEDLKQVDQTLDLWTGFATSHYQLNGQPVTVETVADSDRSLVAVHVESPLLQNGALQVRLHFPYGYKASVKNRPPLIWDQPESHTTRLLKPNDHTATFLRDIDATHYVTTLSWETPAALAEAAPHDYHLRATSGQTLAFTCDFAPGTPTESMPGFAATRQHSAAMWENYWSTGGAIDFAGSTDPRANELERRIILSRYLVRIHYAGAMPPAESGLAHPTWFGKHNSEMIFWHTAHFYMWGHTELLERNLDWYRKILPIGMADAASKGFDGVRWPKMTGPDARPGPGTINPFIIWNQPHPIYLAELVYRAHPSPETLAKYQDIVFESAKFLVSFAYYDKDTDRYVLGPPIRSVNEANGENKTQNPTFELAYWYYGLSLAQQWRTRLGLEPDPHWADIIAKISRLTISEGKYVDIETFPGMYDEPGELSSSMLMAYGFMPLTPMVDPEIMRATLHEISDRNGMDNWVSWASGKAAMTSARLGESERAIAILTNSAKDAQFLPSGFVRRPKEPVTCAAYLPVNGSLLAATGLMAGGWDAAPAGEAPGFPKDGTWHVRVEGMNRMP